MKTEELLEVLTSILPNRELPDGRTVYVKSTAEPQGIPVTGPDGRPALEVDYLGLWVFQRKRWTFIPVETITEVYAENVPEEDDVI